MRYEITGLEISNKIYFSKDGIHFSKEYSMDLHPRKVNVFYADPQDYFIYDSDLIDGSELVGDGEIPAKYSDWHEIIYLEDKKLYIPAPLLFRRVKDHFDRTGSEFQ